MSDADKIADLLNLLRDARGYLERYGTANDDEAHDLIHLIGDIDDVLPVIQPSYEVCDDPKCARPKGHPGEHDDIPF